MTDAQAVPAPDVSRETREKLETLVSLVLKWTPKINLIAPDSVANIWDRHVLDSLQLLNYRPAGSCKWADFGSGAGFPGIVVAIALQEKDSACHVTVVESDQRKAAFLRTAVRELAPNVTVVADRLEDIAPLDADVVSARALMPLDRLLGAIQPHMGINGVALLPKGRRVAEEIDAARRLWSFDCEQFVSATDPESRILRIERIARA